MKMKQLVTPVLVSLTLLGASAVHAEDDAPQGLPAEVIQTTHQPLTHHIEAVGTLQANETIIVRPEQSGQIEQILFREGGQVNAGDKLMVLESSLYQAELQQSKARVNLSRIAYQRAASLVKKRVGSQQDLDSSLAQLKVDQAQQALAQTRLDKMTIRAPFSGTVGLRKVSPGDYVTAGQDLVELTDTSTMKLEFSVPENQLTQLRIGQTVALEVDALRGETFSGRIFAIAPSVDARSHNITLRAEVANPDNLLRPGLFARIRIITGQDDAAVMLPEQAIIPQNNSFFVMKVVDGKVAMAPVELGIRRNGQVHVLAGVSNDEVVITAGQIKLFPGMPVTPIFTDGSQQAAKPGA